MASFAIEKEGSSGTEILPEKEAFFGTEMLPEKEAFFGTELLPEKEVFFGTEMLPEREETELLQKEERGQEDRKLLLIRYYVTKLLGG